MELARGHQTERWRSRSLDMAVRAKSWCGSLSSSHRDVSRRKGQGGSRDHQDSCKPGEPFSIICSVGWELAHSLRCLPPLPPPCFMGPKETKTLAPALPRTTVLPPEKSPLSDPSPSETRQPCPAPRRGDCEGKRVHLKGPTLFFRPREILSGEAQAAGGGWQVLFSLQ